jgi:hypothetical protein
MRDDTDSSDSSDSSDWAVLPLVDWRTLQKDHTVQHASAELRERIASTAERVAHTFELSAESRERMAEPGGPGAEHHLLQAARHRTLADFERRQAQALRTGRLLATPWQPGTNGQKP